MKHINIRKILLKPYQHINFISHTQVQKVLILLAQL